MNGDFFISIFVGSLSASLGRSSGRGGVASLKGTVALSSADSLAGATRCSFSPAASVFSSNESEWPFSFNTAEGGRRRGALGRMGAPSKSALGTLSKSSFLSRASDAAGGVDLLSPTAGGINFVSEIEICGSGTGFDSGKGAFLTASTASGTGCAAFGFLGSNGGVLFANDATAVK